MASGLLIKPRVVFRKTIGGTSTCVRMSLFLLAKPTTRRFRA